MTLHAIENLDDAAAASKEFLLPFDIRQWLKLAVVVFFIGTGMSWPSTGFNASGTTDQPPATELPFAFSTELFLVVAVVVVVVLLVGLLWALIGSIMEFVFIESLRTETVRIRNFWGDRWRQGVRLFAFRIAIGIPVLVLVLGWLALVIVPFIFETVSPIVPIGVFLFGLPVLFVVGLLYAVVHGFTTVFVVPIMILEDRGVLAAWRTFWPSLKREWKQYLVYAVISVVLSFLLGLLASFVLGVAALVVAIPLLAVGVVVYVTISLTSTIGLVLVGLLVGVFILVLAALWAILQVPILTYLRYYALLVLGDVDGSLDLVPDRRDSIRSDG